MDGWMDEWTNEWMDGWMDGWRDGWMNERVRIMLYKDSEQRAPEQLPQPDVFEGIVWEGV